MQTGRIRQCIMYRMAQRCVDIMNVKNVETGFWSVRGDAGVSRKCDADAGCKRSRRG